MASLSEELNLMKYHGASNVEISNWKNGKRLEMLAGGMTEKDIDKEFGITNYKNDESLLGPIKNYWGGVLSEMKEEGVVDYTKKWAVGEDAEWGTYFERAVGKSNINLAKQFHSGGKETFNDSFLGFLTPDKLNYDWKNAFSDEPEDTGAIERLFETLVGLGFDSPFFAAGAVAGLPAGKYGSAFTAGFVNDSIKAMYLEALDRGEVNSFGEWWDIFLKHGVWEGTKGGLTIASMAAAPAGLPYLGLSKNFINKFVSRWAALSYTPVLLGEEWPDKNTLVNNALMLGSFGIAEKGGSMVLKRTIKNKKELESNTKDVLENIDMIEDAASLNKKTFRNDKKLDDIKIKELVAEKSNLEKSLEKDVKEPVKEKIEVSEKEIKDLKLEITRLENLKKTPEKLSTKEFVLLDVKIETAKSKLAEITKPKEKVNVEELSLKQLEEKQSKIFEEIEVIREEKASGLEIDQSKLTKLEKDLEKVETSIKESKVETIGKEDVVKKEVDVFNTNKRIEQIKNELDILEVKPEVEISKEKTEIESSNSIIQEGLKKIRLGKIKKYEGQSWKSALITTWLDGLYPILQAERIAKKIIKFVKDAPTPYTEMRSQHGMVGKAMHFVKTGTLDFNTQLINGKSLLDVWVDTVSFGKKIADMKANLKEANLKLLEAKVAKNKGLIEETTNLIKILEKDIKKEMELIKDRKELDEYAKANGYLVHKRNIELVEKRKIDTGIDVEISKKYIEVKEIKENYSGLQKEMVEYNNRLVDYLVKAGVLPLELAESVRKMNENYVPFYKVIEDAHTNSAFSKVVKNPFKRIKDSKKPLDIIDPIESIFLNTVRFVQIAERNAAYKSFFDMVTKAKEAAKLEKKPDPFPDINISKAPVKKINLVKEDLKGIVENWKEFTEKDLEGLSIFRKESQMISEKQVAVYENGKRVVWDVPPDIGSSINGMNRFAANWIRNTIGLPSQWLRAGATLNPEFMARNISKDTVYGATFSKNWGFLPIWSTIRGIFLRHGIFNKTAYEEFMKSGASQSHLVSIDQRYFRDGRMIESMYKRKMRNWIDPTKILENLRAVSEYAEVASRIADFELTMKRLRKQNLKLPEKDKLTYRQMLHQAGFEGRDLTIDFRKMGYAVQSINQISAFYNAKLQGNLKLWEGMRDRPFQTTTKALAWITLPSVLLWLHNKDSEAYKRLPQWRKDFAWNLPVFEGTSKEIVFSFPKAHGLALLFGSTVERTLDSIYQKNPEIIKEFVKQYTWESMVGLIPIPEFGKPFIENFSNKSTFTKRPIVPEGLKGILPEYQFTQYTSETAKLIGKWISRITYGKAGSPLMIDNWVQSWFGGLGDHMMTTLDMALEKAGIVVPPVDPKSDNWIKNLDDMLIIKAFVARNPDANSEHLTKFWKTYKPISEKLATLNKLKKSGNIEEYLHLFTKVELELAFLEKTAVVLRKNSQMVRMIQASTFMSANEKAQMIDQIYMMMIQTAEMSNAMVDNIKKFKKIKKKNR